MGENKNALKVDDLRDEIRDFVKVLAEQLTAWLVDNLQSITVFGSSLTSMPKHEPLPAERARSRPGQQAQQGSVKVYSFIGGFKYWKNSESAGRTMVVPVPRDF